MGRKLSQWCSERVTGGKEGGAGIRRGSPGPFSGGCLRLQHQLFTDLVGTVCVKSTSCVRNTIPSIPGSWLLLPYRIPHLPSCSSSRAPQLREGRSQCPRLPSRPPAVWVRPAGPPSSLRPSAAQPGRKPPYLADSSFPSHRPPESVFQKPPVIISICFGISKDPLHPGDTVEESPTSCES